MKKTECPACAGLIELSSKNAFRPHFNELRRRCHYSGKKIPKGVSFGTEKEKDNNQEYGQK